MDDQTKHMLLMAAKAGGVPGTFQSWFDDRDNESCGIAPNGAPGRDWWNSRDSDRDAHRLAVKLQFTVYNEHLGSGVASVANADGDLLAEVEVQGGDVLTDADYAATRLAITRAAAAIGEAMP